MTISQISRLIVGIFVLTMSGCATSTGRVQIVRSDIRSSSSENEQTVQQPIGIDDSITGYQLPQTGDYDPLELEQANNSPKTPHLHQEIELTVNYQTPLIGHADFLRTSEDTLFQMPSGPVADISIASQQNLRTFENSFKESEFRLLSDDQEYALGTEPSTNIQIRQPDLNFIDRVFEDHHNYYSCQNLGLLSVGFGIGAVWANSPTDADLSENTYQTAQRPRSHEIAESFHSSKNFGDGLYTLPAFAAAWGIGELWDEHPIGQFAGEWGERSLRGVIVGVPPVIFMQKLTGAGRPEEGNSHWHLWQDTNGVSGHAFMGALPFLTAAQIIEDPWWKAALYLSSTAVPISRVTDGDHYYSQAFLGWWMAWSATMVIDATQDQDSQWRMIPLMGPGYSGLNFEFRW